MPYLKNLDKIVSISFLQLRHVRLSVAWRPLCRMKFNFVVVTHEVVPSDRPSQLHLAAEVKDYFHSSELNLPSSRLIDLYYFLHVLCMLAYSLALRK